MYHRDVPLASVGKQHIEAAVTLLEALIKNPTNVDTVAHARTEFSSAYTDFVQLNADIQTIPSAVTLTPVYGVRIAAYIHLLPISVEASHIGVESCDLITVISSKLHDSIGKKQKINPHDLSSIIGNLQLIAMQLKTVIEQVAQLQPSDLQADPRLDKFITLFNKDLPLLREGIDAAITLLPLAPMLLGTGTPTNYLIELLDSTELRPGGGFIGNYGIATLNNGQFTSVNVTDTYLLDSAFRSAGHSLSFPPEYSWYPTIMNVSHWSLRDSNLDADFPTAARYAELNYASEGGTIPVQGVIAITPAFIQKVLDITGPIVVAGYNETVTSQNLIQRIHYHQVGGGYEGPDTPSPDGKSSVRKHFTALLAEYLMQRLRTMVLLHPSSFMKLFVDAIQTKDMQLYFNNNDAEKLLQRDQLASSIQSNVNDSIFVVDANLSGNKANYLITSILNDQVTIDKHGNATHITTLKYDWNHNGPIYGNSLYSDYVRVYLPSGSKLLSESGWQFYGTKNTFGRSVSAGLFSFKEGEARTITLTWSIANAVSKDSQGFHYRDLIQRQAGAQWQVNIHVTLPSCATIKGLSGGLTSTGKLGAGFTQSLSSDTEIGIDYLC